MYLSPFLQQYLMMRGQNPATAGSGGGVTSLGSNAASQNPLSAMFNPSQVFPAFSGQQGGGGNRAATVGSINTPATSGGYPTTGGGGNLGGGSNAAPLFPSVGEAVKDWTKGIFNGSNSTPGTSGYSGGKDPLSGLLAGGESSTVPQVYDNANNLDYSTGYNGAGTVMGDGGDSFSPYYDAAANYTSAAAGAAPAAETAGNWFSDLFSGWSRGGTVPGYKRGGAVPGYALGGTIDPLLYSTLMPGGGQDPGIGAPGAPGSVGGTQIGGSQAGSQIGAAPGVGGPVGVGADGNPTGNGLNVGRGGTEAGHAQAEAAGKAAGNAIGGFSGMPFGSTIGGWFGGLLGRGIETAINPDPIYGAPVSPAANFSTAYALQPDYATPVQSQQLGALGNPGPAASNPGAFGVSDENDGRDGPAAGPTGHGDSGGSSESGPSDGIGIGGNGPGTGGDGQGQGVYARGGVVPIRYAQGGPIPFGPGSASLISSPVPGRTDAIPATPQPGSVVIPADVVSGAGQGNTMAGDQIIRQMLGGGAPMSMSPQMGGPQMGPQQIPPQQGGQQIQTAGGEEIVDPAALMRIGGGDLRRGQQILNDWIKQERQQTIRQMQELPGPYSAAR